MSNEPVEVKLAEISEQFISIQNPDATFYDHLVKMDAAKLEEFRRIQTEYARMQSELLDLIERI